MSLRTVQLVIGRIVMDEAFRSRFIQEPARTLAELCDQGFELTALEIEALVRTDKRAWTLMAKRIDQRLQGCRLMPDCD